MPDRNDTITQNLFYIMDKFFFYGFVIDPLTYLFTKHILFHSNFTHASFKDIGRMINSLNKTKTSLKIPPQHHMWIFMEVFVMEINILTDQNKRACFQEYMEYPQRFIY
jgi:hypothetical protein